MNWALPGGDRIRAGATVDEDPGVVARLRRVLGVPEDAGGADAGADADGADAGADANGADPDA